MFIPPPRYVFKVVKEPGARLVHLNEALWQGNVEYIDEFELWVPPPTKDGQRLLLVGRLADGHMVVLETTVELFRSACHELGDEH